MKRFILLFTLLLISFSCSKEENNNPKFYLELLPVNKIVLPIEFTKNEVYEIPVSFIRPSICHAFDGIYYDKETNVRTIAVQTRVLDQNNCVAADVTPRTEILRFKPTTESSYVFKIWKGKDASGTNIYEETTVPVVP